jgi:hypothetical protein
MGMVVLYAEGRYPAAPNATRGSIAIKGVSRHRPPRPPQHPHRFHADNGAHRAHIHNIHFAMHGRASAVADEEDASV